MQDFRIVPQIHMCSDFNEFCSSFDVGTGDLILTSRRFEKPFIKEKCCGAKVVFRDDYGKGEPSDEMIDRIYQDSVDENIRRIIAIGGGSTLDIGKLLALDIKKGCSKLFTEGKEAVRKRALIAVPTTCGTGSEMTNVSIASLTSLGIKKGLASDNLFADNAVLLPELLFDIADKAFGASSIDALVHAFESYLSPQASDFSKMYSLEAIRLILQGYIKLRETGNTKENRKKIIGDFLIASSYAGIAFGNAGCGAVHALSYSIGSRFHVPHGEANYRFFIEVMKKYMEREPHGKMEALANFTAMQLNCDRTSVFEVLRTLLDYFMPERKLCDYGMAREDITEFAKATIENQQRLLANNYVQLSEKDLVEIFSKVY